MELLLTILVFMQLVIVAYLVRNILHPLIIHKVIVLIGTIGLFIFRERWSVDISANTVLILIVGIVCVDIGFLLSNVLIQVGIKNKYKHKSTIKYTQDYSNDINYSISIRKTIVCTLIIIVTIIAYLRIGSNYINTATNIEEFTTGLMVYKGQTRSNGDVDLGIWTYILLLSRMIGLVYVYFSVKEYMTKGVSKKLFILILPIISVFIMGYILGIRSILLIYFLVGIFVAYDIQIKENKTNKIKLQIKYVVISLIAALIVFSYFIFAGKLSNKVGENEELNNIAIYTSGGIVAFDEVYEDYALTSETFGEQTLRIIYKVLNIIPWFNFETQETINQTIYGAGGFRTNVYTVNINFIADFGYIGIIIGNSLIGLFHGLLYYKANKEKETGVWVVLNAFFLMPLLAYLGAEKYFAPLTMNTIYFICIYILVNTKILYKKRGNKYATYTKYSNTCL